MRNAFVRNYLKYLGHESIFRDCLGLNIEMHSQKAQGNKDLEHDHVFEHDLSYALILAFSMGMHSEKLTNGSLISFHLQT